VRGTVILEYGTLPGGKRLLLGRRIVSERDADDDHERLLAVEAAPRVGYESSVVSWR
jgi:hypothetical protein